MRSRAVAITWVGSATLFSWGMWITVNVLGGTVLASGGAATALIGLQSFGKVLAGLVLGLVTLMLLIERRHALAGRPTG